MEPACMLGEPAQVCEAAGPAPPAVLGALGSRCFAGRARNSNRPDWCPLVVWRPSIIKDRGSSNGGVLDRRACPGAFAWQHCAKGPAAAAGSDAGGILHQGRACPGAPAGGQVGANSAPAGGWLQRCRCTAGQA